MSNTASPFFYHREVRHILRERFPFISRKFIDEILDAHLKYEQERDVPIDLAASHLCSILVDTFTKSMDAAKDGGRGDE